MLLLLPNSNPTSIFQQRHRRSTLSSFDTDKETCLSIDIPGVKADAIQVSLESSQGRRNNKQHYVLHIRCPSKNVHETFPLDPRKYQIEDPVTHLQDGVLTVTVPKVPPRVISVEKETSSSDNSDSSNSLLTLNMPGVKAEDVAVVVQESRYLVVSGTRRALNEERTSRFQRTFALEQSVDVSTLRANLVDGLLVIRSVSDSKTNSNDATAAVVQTSVVPIKTAALEQTKEDTNGMFHFSAHLPGVNAKDAKIEVMRKDHHSVLSITAKRSVQQRTFGRTNSNEQYATLRKEIALDDDRIDCSQLQASLVDGVLTIMAPRMPIPEPRVLQIQYNATNSKDGDDSDATVKIESQRSSTPSGKVSPSQHHINITDGWEEM